jgi:ParB-like chromosome segregation protein Spo0J
MAKLINQAKNAGMNSDATVLAKMKRVSELKIHPVLESIFFIHEETLSSVTESMKQDGYDMPQPIVLGKIDDEWYIVDGHTRYKGALAAGIEEVPVVEKEFENLEAAIRYCFKRQAERRNLSQAEIYNAAVKLNMPALKLSEEMGVAVSSITRAKKIERETDPEDIAAIKNNEKSINSVYTKIKKSKPKNDQIDNNDETSDNSGSEDDDKTREDLPSDESSEGVSSNESNGDILDGAIAESESGDLDTDILDGAIIESETSGTYEDEDNAIVQTIKNIVNLLSENGETNAVTVIHNKYPGIFNVEKNNE